MALLLSGDGSGSVFPVPSAQACVGRDKALSLPSPSSLRHPVLQPPALPSGLCWTGSSINICLAAWSPNLGILLRTWSRRCQTRGKDHVPRPVSYALTNAAQMLLAFFAARARCRLTINFLGPQILSCGAFKLLSYLFGFSRLSTIFTEYSELPFLCGYPSLRRFPGAIPKRHRQ